MSPGDARAGAAPPRARVARDSPSSGSTPARTSEAVGRYATELGLTFPLVLDPDGKINALYGVIGHSDDLRRRPGWACRGVRRGASRMGEPAGPCAHRGAAGRAGPRRAHDDHGASPLLVASGSCSRSHGLIGRGGRGPAALAWSRSARSRNPGARRRRSSGCATACRSSGTARTRISRSACASPKARVAELLAAARDLVRRGVDIIVTTEGGNAAKAAQMATDRIPIVFIGGGDPVELGLVKSLARPGGNITGIADPGRRARAEADGDLPGAGSRFEACAPRLRRDERSMPSRNWPVPRPPREASASRSWSGRCGARRRRGAMISGLRKRRRGRNLLAPRSVR